MTTSSAADVGAAFSEGSVEADGFTVRYYEAGTGQPLIVLHGAGGVRGSRALDLLVQGRRVILVELPGFGQEPNERTNTPAEMAQTVTEIASALGLDTFQLLGTSMGGAIAVHVALDHPDRVSSMVLEAPGTFRVGATPPFGMSEDDMRRAFRFHPDREPAWEGAHLAKLGQVWPLVDKLMASQPEYDEEIAARLPECNVRTLVVFGDSDGVIPPENGRIFRRLMPNCCYVLMYQAAHDVQADRAEAFADVVGDFLDRGWSFLVSEESTLVNP